MVVKGFVVEVIDDSYMFLANMFGVNVEEPLKNFPLSRFGGNFFSPILGHFCFIHKKICQKNIS